MANATLQAAFAPGSAASPAVNLYGCDQIRLTLGGLLYKVSFDFACEKMAFFIFLLEFFYSLVLLGSIGSKPVCKYFLT